MMIFVLLMTSFLSQAICTDKSASKELNKAGSINYEMVPVNCLKDGAKSKSCYTVWQEGVDHCKDSKTVVKFSCEKQQPISKEYQCPAGETCQVNICKK